MTAPTAITLVGTAANCGGRVAAAARNGVSTRLEEHFEGRVMAVWQVMAVKKPNEIRPAATTAITTITFQDRLQLRRLSPLRRGGSDGS